MTNKSSSKSIELDKKIGIANHVILRPYSKFSRLSNESKNSDPTTNTKLNTILPTFTDKRNTSKHTLPLKRRKIMLKLPIRNNTQRPKFPIRRQTTALTSSSLFKVTHDICISIYLFVLENDYI